VSRVGRREEAVGTGSFGRTDEIRVGRCFERPLEREAPQRMDERTQRPAVRRFRTSSEGGMLRRVRSSRGTALGHSRSVGKPIGKLPSSAPQGPWQDRARKKALAEFPLRGRRGSHGPRDRDMSEFMEKNIWAQGLLGRAAGLLRRTFGKRGGFLTEAVAGAPLQAFILFDEVEEGTRPAMFFKTCSSRVLDDGAGSHRWRGTHRSFFQQKRPYHDAQTIVLAAHLENGSEAHLPNRGKGSRRLPRTDPRRKSSELLAPGSVRTASDRT